MAGASLLLPLLLGSSLGQLKDAPDRLISPHGVELVTDGRVFLLFAALNGLGYSEETESKGPPLRAPVHHPIRSEVTEALRKLKASPRLASIKAQFEENPVEIEVYLAAVLSYDDSLTKPDNDMPIQAQKLKTAAGQLAAFGAEPEVTKIYDEVALANRTHAKDLMARLEKDFAQAEALLGTKDLRAPKRLVVVPNTLDSHGAVRLVELPKATLLVVGPGFESAERAILDASLRPLVRTWVDKGWPNAALAKKNWDGLKIYKKVTDRFPDGQSYLAETLSRALAFRIQSRLSGKSGADVDEDFAESQTKDGLRWTRAVLKALEGLKDGELEASMPRIVARVNP
jgi:hypothetical protein